MPTYFVSRHPGALEWSRRRGIQARHVPHLDTTILQPGDTVIGTLPVHLVAEACARGVTYLHLRVDVPAHWRGHELDADQLEELEARLVALACHYVPS